MRLTRIKVCIAKKGKKVQLQREQFMFIVAAVTLLAALVVISGLANTMNMTRFYHILLFILAPLCILGIENFVKLISKR